MWTRVHVQTEKEKYRHTLHIPLTKLGKLSKRQLWHLKNDCFNSRKSHKNWKLKHAEWRKTCMQNYGRQKRNTRSLSMKMWVWWGWHRAPCVCACVLLTEQSQWALTDGGGTTPTTASQHSPQQSSRVGRLLVSVCKFIFFYLQNVEFPSILKETDWLTGLSLDLASAGTGP